MKFKEKLKIAGYTGIIALVLTLVSVFFSTGYEVTKDPTINIIGKLFSFGATLFGLVFLWGYWHMGKKWKFGLLKVSVIYLMIISFIVASVSMIPFEGGLLLITGLVSLVLIGIGSLLFGIGLLPLKKKVGSIATYAGVLEIITGATLVTVIFFPLGIITSLIALILEIIILFRKAK